MSLQNVPPSVASSLNQRMAQTKQGNNKKTKACIVREALMLSTQYVLKRKDFFFNTVLRRVTRTQVQLAASIIKLKRSRLGGRIELQQKCHLSAERTKQPNIITQHRLLESAIETTGLMFFISHRAHHQRETPPDDTGPKNTGPQPSRNCAPPPKKINQAHQTKDIFFRTVHFWEAQSETRFGC